MSYRPEGVSEVTIGPGTHPVFMTGIKRITDRDKLAKFNAQAVFIASFKSVETAVEKDLTIKFSGAPSDHYAGLNIDRLHLAAGELDDENVDTLNGYITQKLGRWPKAGDSVPIGRYIAKVVTVTETRAGQVLIVPSTQQVAKDDGPGTV